ncbi:MAG: RHS repeat-associated core domain-containing protein [Planctomycetota bacterium]|jgi:RHS repeat-associated protein
MSGRAWTSGRAQGGLGSTRALTDAAGIATDTYIYEAFGDIVSQTGSTPNSYMFTGEQYDPNVGFYYLRARYYNPSVGRFHTVDPWQGSIYDPVSLHRYLYAHADPVNLWDPSGKVVTLLELTIVSAVINVLIAEVMYFLLTPRGETTVMGALKAMGIAALTGAAGGAAGGFMAWLFTNSLRSALFTGMVIGGVGALAGSTLNAFGRWAVYGEAPTVETLKGIVIATFAGVVAGGFIAKLMPLKSFRVDFRVFPYEGMYRGVNTVIVYKAASAAQVLGWMLDRGLGYLL